MITHEPVASAGRLTKNAQAATELSLEDRIAYIRKPKWFEYRKARETLEKLEDLMVYPKNDRMPNLLIAGHTNNGKTTLVKRFLDRYPACDNPDGGAIKVPVFYTMAPPVPDESRFYDQILDDLYAPYRSTDKPSKKEKEVLRLLQTIDTRMLVIDEIHNMIAGPLIRQHGQLNAIKNLGNKLRIPIIAVGTKEAFAAIRANDQLSNRFKHVYLDLWKPDKEFILLLRTFERALSLKEPSFLDSKEISKHLFYMCEGILGELAEIISETAVLALRKGEERITLERLESLEWIRPSKRATTM